LAGTKARFLEEVDEKLLSPTAADEVATVEKEIFVDVNGSDSFRWRGI
jgi:hypothetical protein